MSGLCVSFGLNRVNPRFYSGWHGSLRACESDARDMESIAAAQGFRTIRLTTKQCTRKALGELFSTAAQELVAGDIFLFTFSGHGGQLRDLNSEEKDALDETLCLYDGQWLDDETRAALRGFRRGVRVLFITDCCNSGTTSRAPMARARMAPGIKSRGMPTWVAERTYASRKAFYNGKLSKARQQLEEPLRATFIGLGGSVDGETAADGVSNGRFTAALKSVWRNGTFKGGYESFFSQIQNALVPSQTPSYQGEGPRRRAFESQIPFSIEGRIAVNPQIKEAPGPAQAKEAPGPAQAKEAPSSINTWGRSAPGVAKAADSRTAAQENPSAGDYVASKTEPNQLFLFDGETLESISPEQASSELTQDDVKFFSPLVLASYPKSNDRGPGDQTFYLYSDLRSGHLLESWGWFDGNQYLMRTITQATTWFGGWRAGVTALLVRENGTIIPSVEIRTRYGCDGRAFGSGMRDETESWEISPDVIDEVDHVIFLHYWDPKAGLIDSIVQAAETIWELVKTILDAYDAYEEVSAGGDVV
ncbi:caspase family protein [Arthrobacter sp. LAR12-1-1.1]|uniref:caspase family protein n=1 Tax=Arthrobacter sp. LAR12-1-1.1 TaxID=3135215 RepID=UPI003437738A